MTLAVVAIGVAISVWCSSARGATIPRTAAGQPLALRPGRPERPVRRRVQRGGVHAPGQRLTDGLVRLEDSGIDGTVNGTATAIGGLSGRLRRFQNGFVRTYALTMTAGAAVVGAVLVLGRLG